MIVQGAGIGDGVYRLPVTGNETVLDAIAQLNGFEPVSSKRVWIARPSDVPGQQQILPVDWYAISELGSSHTNYQILPGDRVFIAEDKLVAFDNALIKLISPLERLMGFTLLGTETATRLSGPVLRGGGNPTISATSDQGRRPRHDPRAGTHLAGMPSKEDSCMSGRDRQPSHTAVRFIPALLLLVTACGCTPAVHYFHQHTPACLLAGDQSLYYQCGRCGRLVNRSCGDEHACLRNLHSWDSR